MIEIEWVGQVEYGVAWEWQKALVAERAASPETAGKLLLLEHPPTYTLGRRGRLEHLLLDEAGLAERGIAVYMVDRGGDITYHGPGQLVAYPILNLKHFPNRYGLSRVTAYVRDIEEVIIQVLAEYHITGYRIRKYTGVWVDTGSGPAKIAAIGIRVSGRGITSHGFALNVTTDLSYFDGIIPCGIQDHGVTSMAVVLGRPLSITELLPHVAAAFGRVFQVETSEIITRTLHPLSQGA
ncbi:MAG: lipoyl(octanoyl) transferase LipB [Anaerolineae bacterium]